MRKIAVAGLVLVQALALSAPLAAQSLKSYRIDETGISVSGISSGGYMAVQMHVAFSARFQGAAVVAGGPYHCAEGSMRTATSVCMSGTPDVRTQVAETRARFGRGAIDDPAGLRDDKVLLFSGRKDTTVKQTVMNALYAYYLEFLPPERIVYVNDLDAAHAMITDDYGSACDVTAPPYINNCRYDAAGEILKFIYGDLRPKGTPVAANLLAFDQGEFGRVSYGTSLHRTGHVYVPAACAAGTTACRLHVAFHGCQQSQDDIGDQFTTQAGYNEWAESNNIIVLYPQVRRVGNDWSYWWSLTWDGVYNPRGCWDWWGQSYTGRDYDTKTGAQPAAVIAMIDRLLGRR